MIKLGNPVPPVMEDDWDEYFNQFTKESIFWVRRKKCIEKGITGKRFFDDYLMTWGVPLEVRYFNPGFDWHSAPICTRSKQRAVPIQNEKDLQMCKSFICAMGFAHVWEAMGQQLKIENPVYISVSSSGGHRVCDANGVSYYIQPGWRWITWTVKEGFPNFVK